MENVPVAGAAPTDVWSVIAPALTHLVDAFPFDAIATANAHWDEVAPHLVRALEQAAEDPTDALSDTYALLLHAMFLLAQHRDPRAYRPLLRIAALPEETLEPLLQDAITDGLGRCLASVCEGDEAPLKALAEDESAYVWARNAALEALAICVVEGDSPRAPFIEYLGALARDEAQRLRDDEERDTLHLTNIVCQISDLGARPLLSEIRGWYDEDLIDDKIMDLAWIKEHAALSVAELNERFAEFKHYVVSAQDELANWHCFQPETEDAKVEPVLVHDSRHEGTFRRDMPRVGRNDPCPCGSGKKFKKCCGAA